jgi:hypothetical protein
LPHRPPLSLDPRADSPIHCVGRALEREHHEDTEHCLQLRDQTLRTSLRRSEAEFRRNDDAGRDFRLANGFDPFGNCTLRLPDEVRLRPPAADVKLSRGRDGMRPA